MAAATLDIDLTSQSFMRNPFPTLTQLRWAGAVVRMKVPFLGKTWMATTYAAVTEVLRDDRTFVRSPKNAGKKQIAGMRWWMPRSLRLLAENMLSYDDPDHRRLRKLVDQAFSRQSVESMREHIGSICDGLLERMADVGSGDIMEGLARPLPLAVICELLGLPEEDRPNFRSWVKTLMSATSLWGVVRFLPALFKLVAYFRRHFEECRRQPRPGLMTALVQAEEDRDKLSENELVAMAFLLLVAGHETTLHLIGGGVLALIEGPEQRASLLADWSLGPSAVEELLRFVCPVQIAKPRYVARDIDFHGQKLRRGEVLIPVLASANTDPGRFANPEKMDLSRSPNPHVAFGTGMHFCLGAQLARVEAQVAIQKLFTRFPGVSLKVPSAELSYTGRLGIRALKALPVQWT
jgi:cytochrome P450